MREKIDNVKLWASVVLRMYMYMYMYVYVYVYVYVHVYVYVYVHVHVHVYVYVYVYALFICRVGRVSNQLEDSGPWSHSLMVLRPYHPFDSKVQGHITGSQWAVSSLIRVKPSRLCVYKPLGEPMLIYFWLDLSWNCYIYVP